MPDKDIIHIIEKRKLQANISHEHRCKILNKVLANQEGWCQPHGSISSLLWFTSNWTSIIQKKYLYTAHQATWEIHPPCTWMWVDWNLRGGWGPNTLVAAGAAVGQHAIRAMEVEGQSSEWGSPWPCMLELEGPIALSEDRLQWLRGQKGKRRRQREPKCPSTEEWIKKMWYIYTMGYYSAIKKKAICSNMDGPRDYHTKWSKSDKDKYHMISLICRI